jgi:hypothetical protein
MRAFLFWQRWLLIVGVGVTLFGVFMALSNSTPLFSSFNDQIDPVFWASQDPSTPTLRFRAWVYGVWGATVAGWGLTLTFLALHPFKRRERWARNAMFYGLSLWYLLDTGLSICFGVYFNALFNTLLIVLAGLPLIFTWGEFGGNGRAEQRRDDL